MRSPDDYTVRVGSTYEDRGGEQYKASTVYCKIWSNLNDIGMLKLSNRISLDGSTKKALSLPTSSDYYPETDMNLYIQGCCCLLLNLMNFLSEHVLRISTYLRLGNESE